MLLNISNIAPEFPPLLLLNVQLLIAMEASTVDYEIFI